MSEGHACQARHGTPLIGIGRKDCRAVWHQKRGEFITKDICGAGSKDICAAAATCAQARSGGLGDHHSGGGRGRAAALCGAAAAGTISPHVVLVKARVGAGAGGASASMGGSGMPG